MQEIEKYWVNLDAVVKPLKKIYKHPFRPVFSLIEVPQSFMSIKIL